MDEPGVRINADPDKPELAGELGDVLIAHAGHDEIDRAPAPVIRTAPVRRSISRDHPYFLGLKVSLDPVDDVELARLHRMQVARP